MGTFTLGSTSSSDRYRETSAGKRQRLFHQQPWEMAKNGRVPQWPLTLGVPVALLLLAFGSLPESHGAVEHLEKNDASHNGNADAQKRSDQEIFCEPSGRF
jgi:hypothetical protein